MARPSSISVQRKKALAAKWDRDVRSVHNAEVKKLQKDLFGARKWALIMQISADKKIKTLQDIINKSKKNLNGILSQVILRGIQFEKLVEQRSTGAAPLVGFRPLELNATQTEFVNNFLETLRECVGPMAKSLNDLEEQWSPFNEMAGPWDPDVPAWIDGVSPAPPAPPAPPRRLTPTPLVNPWRTASTEAPPAPDKNVGPWKKKREVEMNDPNWAPKSAEEPNVWVMKPPLIVLPPSKPVAPPSRKDGPHPTMRVPKGYEPESDSDYDWGMEIEIN